MCKMFDVLLLQLWTMYCEQVALMNPPQSEEHTIASVTILDFWGRVTPGVLQLLSHSKVVKTLNSTSLLFWARNCFSVIGFGVFIASTDMLWNIHYFINCHSMETIHLTRWFGFDLQFVTWLIMLIFFCYALLHLLYLCLIASLCIYVCL